VSLFQADPAFVDRWRRNQIAITATALVGFTGFTLVMPLLAFYMQDLGVRGTGAVALWTGATLGVTPAIAALCAPWWGRIGDRFGNKLLVQRSLVSGIVVMALMAWATRPWHLLALRTIQGFVGGYGPLTLAMAALSAPRERMAQAIGTVQTAQRIGPAIGPVVGGVLASAVGLRSAFVVAAAVYAAAFLIVTTLYVDPARPGAEARPDRRGRVRLAGLLAIPNMVLFMTVIFVLQLVDRSFGPVLVLYLDERGFAEPAAAVFAGVLFSTLAFAGALGNQLAARLLRRWSARATLARAVVVAAAAEAVFALGRDAWVLVSAVAVFGASVGTALTTAFTAAGSVIPRHVHGASFGLLTGASLVGSAVSPLVSAWVASGSLRVVFVSGAVLLATLALAVRRVLAPPTAAIESVPSVDDV
jgi:DHA1 family multidrug resistance protein-like MFS transporter